MTDKQIIIDDCPHFISGCCQEYLDGVCENHKCDLKIIRELEQQLKAKEQECEVLTLDARELDKHLQHRIEMCDKCSEQLDQLKAENKELKKQVDITQMFLDACNNSCEYYKQTLTEIKFWARELLKRTGQVVPYEIKQILQKISECEGNDGTKL